MILGMGFSTHMLEDGMMILRVSMVDTKLEKETLRKVNCSSFAIKRSCAWQRHGLKKKTEKSNRKHSKDVKAISWELQHRLVVTDIDKGNLKVVKNKEAVRITGAMV